MMRITHISDTHGKFPVSPKSTLITVHSGDIFPNFSRVDPEKEVVEQEKWMIANIDQIKTAIGHSKFLFIKGNHDYFNPEALLRAYEIDAHDIEGKLIKMLGLTFYGFPWIPFIAGEWNYETLAPEMSKRVQAIPKCDILVAHCPPFGICADVEDGKGGGNSILLNWLAYEAIYLPRYLMCGHFHDSRGIAIYEDSSKANNMIVSNAATVQHTFEVENS